MLHQLKTVCPCLCVCVSVVCGGGGGGRDLMHMYKFLIVQPPEYVTVAFASNCMQCV